MTRIEQVILAPPFAISQVVSGQLHPLIRADAVPKLISADISSGPSSAQVDAKIEDALAGFLQGLPAQLLTASASDEPYIHHQTTPSSIWTVVHNLGHLADITIIDGTGEQVVGQISHDNNNQSTLTFSQPITGTARAD